MLSRLPAATRASLAARLPAVRRPRLHRAAVASAARRLAHFWLVWSALLLVHEGGHAWSARRQGLTVRRVTVGAGPVLWRGEHQRTELVLRLVPVSGMTSVRTPAETEAQRGWAPQGATLAGGVVATLALAVLVAGVVATWERGTRRRWVWGRILVADALVLTVFNFLPVPPLDGGRAMLGAIASWRGAPLPADALFWVQLGGLALAIVPMTLWTRWTARIDAFALRWGAPPPDR